MKLLACFLAVLSIMAVKAENVYISYPGPGVTWNPGANVAIRWSMNPGGIPVEYVNLDIMNGDAANAVLVSTVAVNIYAKHGVYHWIVPVDFEPRRDYFIRATAAGTKGVSYFYSGRFGVGGVVWAATAPVQPWQEEEAQRLRNANADEAQRRLQEEEQQRKEQEAQRQAQEVQRQQDEAQRLKDEEAARIAVEQAQQQQQEQIQQQQQQNDKLENDIVPEALPVDEQSKVPTEVMQDHRMVPLQAMPSSTTISPSLTTTIATTTISATTTATNISSTRTATQSSITTTTSIESSSSILGLAISLPVILMIAFM